MLHGKNVLGRAFRRKLNWFKNSIEGEEDKAHWRNCSDFSCLQLNKLENIIVSGAGSALLTKNI